MPKGTSLRMVAPQPYLKTRNIILLILYMSNSNLENIANSTKLLPHCGSRLHCVKRILACTLEILEILDLMELLTVLEKDSYGLKVLAE